MPDVARGDGPPQVADELLGVIAGVHDPMVLPDKFLSRVPGDLAERVVDVGDAASDVGGRHDGRVIERPLEIGELVDAGRRAGDVAAAVRGSGAPEQRRETSEHGHATAVAVASRASHRTFPVSLTVSTGHGAARTTRSATLPISRW